jgi:hypothetical protein
MANLPVAIKENVFEILYLIHCINRSHPGVIKTEHQVKSRYSYGITRHMIEQFIRLCPTCNLSRIQHTQARIKCIRSEEFFSRVQIDLVDMRHNQCLVGDRTYRWICHVEDHFTKFHILWPQEHKTAEEVCYGLKHYVFAYFGLPNILQSDNGLEFKNTLVRNLLETWEGSCKMIHGRPRHPQTQGLVEQSNGTMERMLSSMIHQFNNNQWVEFLPTIMYNMNTQLSSSNFSSLFSLSQLSVLSQLFFI